MPQNSDKAPRNFSTRTQLMNEVINCSRGMNQRSSSAKVMPTPDRGTVRNLYPSKTRSSSARVPRPEPTPEPEVVIEDNEPQEEHKSGCPWRKGRSRSKYRLNLAESSSGMLHPKPWGARNPNDIPCFCNLPKGQRESSRGPAARSPSRIQDFMTRHERQASRTKVAEIVSALCTILERKKIKLTDIELTLLLEKVKEKLQKYKEHPVQNQQQPQQKQNLKQQQQQKQQASEEKKSPVRRPRNVQSLSPTRHPNNYPTHRPSSKENLADQPRAGSPLVGKLETKKYWIELTAEEQVPSDLKQFIGMMNHHRPEKQVVLLEDNLHPYGPPEDMRQYTVMNTGVQLRHHAENTTLLLGNQGITQNHRIKSLPPSNMAQQRLSLPHINMKPRRA